MNVLQFIARRYIVCGEELTIDYATILPSHPPFRCSCGTNECREEWFRKRYGTYVRPYVRMLMEIDEAKKNLLENIQQVRQNAK